MNKNENARTDTNDLSISDLNDNSKGKEEKSLNNMIPRDLLDDENDTVVMPNSSNKDQNIQDMNNNLYLKEQSFCNKNKNRYNNWNNVYYDKDYYHQGFQPNIDELSMSFQEKNRISIYIIYFRYKFKGDE
jgi:hypothetical protein